MAMKWKRMRRSTWDYFQDNPELIPEKRPFQAIQADRDRSGCDKQWQRLWEPVATRLSFVEDFIAYANDPKNELKCRKLTMEHDFEDCDSPSPHPVKRKNIGAKDEEEEVYAVTDRGSIWRLAVGAFSRLLAIPTLPRRFFTNIPDESYCRTDEDVHELAWMTIRCAGLKLGGTDLSDEDAIQKGQEAMKRTVSQYAEWLHAFIQKDHRIAMFCTSLDKRSKGRKAEQQRIGTSVIIPLNEARAYVPFSDGLREETSLGPGDIDLQSGRLLMNALGEVRQRKELGKSSKRLQIVQFRTVFYQLASLCPPIWDGYHPTIIMFNAIPEHEERAIRFGFDRSGKKLAGEVYDLLELRPYHEREQDPTRGGELLYDIMVAFIKHVQRILASNQNS